MKRGTIAVILAAALIVGLGGGWLLARGGLGGSALSLLASPSPTGRFNVLLLGADDRPDEPGRSDTAILLSVDLKMDKVSMLSIPRDTWSNIPGHGWDKFNHAYAFGKEQLSIKTLEGLLGLPVDHYVVVNMQGFQKIVDTLGGVTIDVEKDLNYEDPYDTPPLKIHLKKGVQRLTGYQALGYVRFRHDSESDWGRMARQQKFIRALAAEALKPQNLTKLPTLSSEMYGAVRTDLSRTQLLRLGMTLAKGLDPQSMQAVELKGQDRTFGGIYYMQLDFLDARRIAYKALKGTDPDAAFLAKTQADYQTYMASINAEVQRQTALAKAAEDAAKKAAEPSGGTPGTGGGTTTPGTGGTTVSPVEVRLIDASGKGLGPRYVGLLNEQGFKVTQSFVASEPQAATQIIVHQADAATLQKAMSLLPGASLVIQPPAAGVSEGLEIILGQNLPAQG